MFDAGTDNVRVLSLTFTCSETFLLVFVWSGVGSKQKVTPSYEVRPAGPKHRQRFLCELRVPGFEYVAAGNSTNKKDAQANAARDFVAFLVRQGYMQNRLELT